MSKSWLTEEQLDGLDPELVIEIGEALAAHEWEDGYDRNSSHEQGRYVAYQEGLSHVFNEVHASIYGTLLAIHALKILRAKGLLL